MKVWAIAANTFREAVRDKTLYSLLFFAISLIAVSAVLDRLAIGQQAKIITDLGLASISLFGNMIAIFVGIGLVYKEIDRRTIFTIASKPVSRGRFLLGKYLGLVMTLFLEITIMGACFLGMLAIYTDGLIAPAVLAIGMIFLQVCVVIAVALLFSSFSSPFLSGLFTVAIWIIGHLTSDVKAFGEKIGGVAAALTKAIYWILPNLRNFDVKVQVVHSISIPESLVIFALLYALVYVAFLLTAATLIFERRDFT
jgi:ABC-type transport system involved in multi-copper enzyme maturation permease subunit